MPIKRRIDDKDLASEIIKLQSQVGTITRGAAVPAAAGANPTAAEFLALLDSLRASGHIAT